MSAADLRHVDLSQGLPELAPDGAVVRWYLWWRTRPLGVLALQPWQLPVTRSRLVALVAAAIAPAVGDLLHPDSIFTAALPDEPPPDPAPVALADLLDEDPLARLDAVVQRPPRTPDGVRTVSVVVCTRDRPESLERCLLSLQALRRPPDELVVVDNAPSNGAARAVAQAAGATYVLEPRPGLSHARNAAIAATTGDVVAFTDDDVLVHPDWLGRLLAGFRAPEIMAVTGLVLPHALETTAQLAFEDAVGGFGQGFRDREFDHEWLLRQRRRPAHVWKVGAGASVAFRREAFERVGGFDPRLGAGAAGCSEDSELWHRLLTGGWRCRYEPWSVVYHVHRLGLDELRNQSYAYLRGHTAALAVQWKATHQVGEPRRALLGLPRYYLGRGLRRVSRQQADLTLAAEVRGYLAGLWAAGRMLAGPSEPAPESAGQPEQPGLPGQPDKAPLAEFLSRNPFAHGRTLGLFYGEKMAAIHAVSPDRGVQRVVEVGGGQSGLAAALYPSASVLTVDLDPSFGGRHDLYGAPGRGFVAGDASRLPLAECVADVVTLFDVLEHLPDHQGAVREALRILRPGGHLLVTTPAATWRFPYYAVYRRFTPTEADVMGEWGHVRRGYSVSELDQLVGRPHDALAAFITPVTVVMHDLAFSRLPHRAKRVLGFALAPVVLPAARLHRPGGAGTEYALRWSLP